MKYNNYDNITHYYSEMSAMGDYIDNNNMGRITNISRPYLVVHALDDPLITWKTLTSGTSATPDDISGSGDGNIIMMITNSGGHVGWPQGLLPRRNGWSFMNNVVRDFVNAVDNATRNA